MVVQRVGVSRQARWGRRTREEKAANQEAFLEVYKVSFGKKYALEAIGIRSLNTLTKWLKEERFAKRFAEATEVCVDNAERILYEAAMGKIELGKNQFLPLAMFLRGNKAEKYNDRASFEFIHSLKKGEASRVYRELLDELKKPDVRAALPSKDIREAELPSIPGTMGDTQ
jgi:hypothetical protein